MKKIRLYLTVFFLISSVAMKLFGKETELIEKRNFTAKTYRLDDGTYKKVLSVRPMHYRDDNGNLIDIQKGTQYEDQLNLAIQQMNNSKKSLAKASSNRNFNDGGAYTEYNYQKMTIQYVQYYDYEDSCYYWRNDTTYSDETGYSYYGDLYIGFEIETNPPSLGPEGVSSEVWRSLLSWNTTGSGITEDGSVLIDTLKLVLGYYEAFNSSPDNFMIDVNSIGEYAITEEPTADDYALISDGDNILSADICTHNYPYDDSLVYVFTSGAFYDDFTYCWNN